MNRIRISDAGRGIFKLTMDDPENSNRLGEELFHEIIATLSGLSGNDNIKVLIISGRKDAFCTGGSIDLLRKLATRKIDERILFSLPNQLIEFPVPIVAEMEGHAIGSGLILGLYCEMSVAAEESRYGANFTDLGFTPGMGTTTVLPAAAGYQFANEMILTAKLYRGKELKERKLFNYVVPAEDVSVISMDIAKRVAEKPRHVLKMLKTTMSSPKRLALQSAMSHEQLMLDACFGYAETTDLIEQNYLK